MAYARTETRQEGTDSATLAGAPAGWGGTSSWSVSSGTATMGGLGSGLDGNGLLCYGFGFTIPSSATVLGFGVRVNVDATAVGSGITFANPTGISFVTGADTSPLRASDARTLGTAWHAIAGWTTTIGGSSDMWGTSFTPADVNDSGFGMRLHPHSSGGTNTAYVYDWEVICYYEVSAMQQSMIF